MLQHAGNVSWRSFEGGPEDRIVGNEVVVMEVGVEKWIGRGASRTRDSQPWQLLQPHSTTTVAFPQFLRGPHHTQCAQPILFSVWSGNT
jgi:hypothetical protein